MNPLEARLQIRALKSQISKIKNIMPQYLINGKPVSHTEYLRDQRAKLGEIENKAHTPKLDAWIKPWVAATYPAKPATAAAPTAAPAAAPGLQTAATFATPALEMARAEFAKLTAADKSRFSLTGGKLV
jgi:hypothetical protein